MVKYALETKKQL